MTTNTQTNSIFTSKEHYLAFRAAWAKNVNDSSFQIDAAHHMMYNILRGRAFDKGFTPITRQTKLQNGYRINHGLYLAAQRLRYPSEWLSIFEGTVSKEMIADIQIPEVKPMDADYGPYKKVANHIMRCELDDRPHNFDDIAEILESLTEKEAA